ncbi:hypothetical protein [Ferruginibacter albus]|uniref:hypothetical protein n=1 Tax=Ferruginibacter albus TaxID=2875540 RepID=UPI001CC3DF21|nr:hypothetical protein [Ferruginibacter albus]UAY51224.1 hypothetical protein K9M53_11555 [Ferruginibacter albus]
MKVLGFILIAAGILMFVFHGINFTKEKKVVDIGAIEINKNETKRIEWPTYAGVIALLGGITLLVIDKRKES